MCTLCRLSSCTVPNTYMPVYPCIGWWPAGYILASPHSGPLPSFATRIIKKFSIILAHKNTCVRAEAASWDSQGQYGC